MLKKHSVKIMPCDIGMGYHVLIKKEWVCFCYVWSFLPFSEQWWKSLIFITDTDMINFLQYSEKLKKRK